MSKAISILDRDYTQWVKELVGRYRRSQIKAAVKVNSEMLRYYWCLGRDIVEMHVEECWGESVIKSLSADLQREFPDAQGFSRTNLYYIKKFYLLYSPYAEFVPQVEGKISGDIIALEFVPQVEGHQLRKEGRDNPTIGLLICKQKSNTLAQYALESSSQPLGISEYELEKFYPEKIEGTMPTIEEIEAKLGEREN